MSIFLLFVAILLAFYWKNRTTKWDSKHQCKNCGFIGWEFVCPKCGEDDLADGWNETICRKVRTGFFSSKTEIKDKKESQNA